MGRSTGFAGQGRCVGWGGGHLLDDLGRVTNVFCVPVDTDSYVEGWEMVLSLLLLV